MTPQVYFYLGFKNVSLIEISPVYWYHWPVDNNQEYVFIRSHSSELIASYWSCSMSKTKFGLSQNRKLNDVETHNMLFLVLTTRTYSYCLYLVVVCKIYSCFNTCKSIRRIRVISLVSWFILLGWIQFERLPRIK